MPKRLYFIAIEIPEPFKSEINNLKERISSEYSAKHALKTPPHITLQMPMRIEEEHEISLLDSMKNLDGVIKRGRIRLNNISSFPPRTIFIDVLAEGLVIDLFNAVQEQLKKTSFILDKITPSSFHPHITLMTRDLSKKMYHTAMKNLQELRYKEEIEIEKFHLYRHDGKFWRVLNEFKLK